MTIEQTVTIPDDYRIFLDLPHSIPSGARVRVSIAIPTVFENQNTIESQLKSFRGILKGKGISIERLREMQREDKDLEDVADNRQNREIR